MVVQHHLSAALDPCVPFLQTKRGRSTFCQLTQSKQSLLVLHTNKTFWWTKSMHHVNSSQSPGPAYSSAVDIEETDHHSEERPNRTGGRINGTGGYFPCDQISAGLFMKALQKGSAQNEVACLFTSLPVARDPQNGG